MKKNIYTAPSINIVVLEPRTMIAASLGGTNIGGLENEGDANDGDKAGARGFGSIWDDEE